MERGTQGGEVTSSIGGEMNSKDVRRYGFDKWHEFSIRNEHRLLRSVPQEKGVYVIKYERHFGRFRGKSDIMYFGSSEDKKHGLRRRIRFFFHPGKTQTTSKRINEWMNTSNGFELSFITRCKRKKPRALEAGLRTKYEEEHGEFPPWNRRA